MALNAIRKVGQRLQGRASPTNTLVRVRTASMSDLGRRAKEACRFLAAASTSAKDEALQAAADLLEARGDSVLAANEADVERAENAGTNPTVVDRLRLTPARVSGMAAGLR